MSEPLLRSEREIAVIPRSVDLQEFDKIGEEDGKVICHSQNFRPINRIADIIRAFKIVRDSKLQNELGQSARKKVLEN